ALGRGYGQLTLTATGGARLAGKLPDASPLTATGGLNADNTLPLFTRLYKNAGSVGGIMTFQTLATSGVDGTLEWFRPTLSAAQLGAHGSRYLPPATGTRALDLPNGLGKLRLTGGEIFSSPVERNITIGTDNVVTFETPDGTTMKITAKTGLFTGKFVQPVGAKARTFNGILQPAAKAGGGSYPGDGHTGLVEVLAR
ncbi:MAG: hypothetical protein WCF18_24820, partial [Chthoniobacteraceae bacterium]